MSKFRTVIRLHAEINRRGSWVMWAILVAILLINIGLIAIMQPDGGSSNGGLAALPSYLVAVGVIGASRIMPFAMTMGVTRAVAYRASVTAMALLSACWAAIATVLAQVERLTGGWGVGVSFFRIAGPLGDTWYATFILMVLAMVTAYTTGWCFGIVHRRWGIVGVLIGIGVVLVLIATGIVGAAAPQFAPWLSRMVTGVSAGGLLIAIAVALVLTGALGHVLTRRTAV